MRENTDFTPTITPAGLARTLRAGGLSTGPWADALAGRPARHWPRDSYPVRSTGSYDFCQMRRTFNLNSCLCV